MQTSWNRSERGKTDRLKGNTVIRQLRIPQEECRRCYILIKEVNEDTSKQVTSTDIKLNGLRHHLCSFAACTVFFSGFTAATLSEAECNWTS